MARTPMSTCRIVGTPSMGPATGWLGLLTTSVTRASLKMPPDHITWNRWLDLSEELLNPSEVYFLIHLSVAIPLLPRKFSQCLPVLGGKFYNRPRALCQHDARILPHQDISRLKYIQILEKPYLSVCPLVHLSKSPNSHQVLNKSYILSHSVFLL